VCMCVCVSITCRNGHNTTGMSHLKGDNIVSGFIKNGSFRVSPNVLCKAFDRHSYFVTCQLLTKAWSA
jgi:hypothetical protein